MSSERQSLPAGRARLALALIAAAVPAACGDLVDPERGFPVHAELIGPDTIALGDEVTMSLRLTDEDGRQVRGIPVEWHVARSHENVSIFASGAAADPMAIKLRAIHAGQAGIEVRAFGTPRDQVAMLEQFLWSVSQGVRIDGVDDSGEVTLLLGHDTTLTANVLDVDGQPFPGGGTIYWDVSPVDFGDVRIDGSDKSELQVHAAFPGTVIVSARTDDLCAGRCADTVIVRIIQEAGTIQIVPIGRLVRLDQRAILSASVTDVEGKPVYGAQVDWSLADPADSVTVALVGDTVIARGNGSARIVARHADLADTMTVEVWQQIAELVVPGFREMLVGTADTLSVEAYDDFGAERHLVTRPYDWIAVSSDPAVVEAAALDSGLEILARAPGKASVTVSAEGRDAQLQVVVNPPFDGIEVRLADDTLTHIGDVTTAEAWGWIGADTFRIDAEYSSSDPDVAFLLVQGTVVVNVTVVAQSPGTAWVRAQAGGQVDSARITVHQVPASLSLEPATAFVALNGTIPFRALAVDSTGHAIASPDVTFSSSAPAILDIDTAGTATAYALGQATVSAAAGDFLKFANATVIRPVIGAGLGLLHACFIVDDGTLYCFGNNDAGELGDGTLVPRSVPAPTATSLRFTRVAAGTAFTCGIATDGKTYCWGTNEAGQLGDGGSTAMSTTPVQVPGDPGFVELSAGSNHACGITAAGAAYCWGSNNVGQAGVDRPDSIVPLSPVAGGLSFRSLDAGSGSTCAIATDGAAYCWGSLPGMRADQPLRIASTHDFVAISALGCAIADDATLHCMENLEMVPVPGGRRYRDVVSGYGFTCALAEDGSVYCSGLNNWGQLGTDEVGSTSGFVRAELDSPATFLAAGTNSACAGNAGGGLTCWGHIRSTLFPEYGGTSEPLPLVHP
ncbi:MAG TPA: hypothetical protein VF158_12665 [Longimicrobiales bacterium]